MDTQDGNIMTIKQRITTIFLSCCLAFSAHAQLQQLDFVVAQVDDDIILHSELQQRIEMIKRQNRGNTLPNDALLRDQVLERMIIESIQLQMADRGGIRISEAQLNDALERIALQNDMSLPQFQQAMEAEGTSFQMAREQIRTEMRISRVQRFQVGERIQITDQDVDYFLASDLGRMASSAEYNLAHILIATPENASASDIRNAQNKANTLVQQLRAGADFKQVAIANSNARNALEGGDLGWRKEAQLPSLFAPIATQLAVGEISDPISSSGGFHIVTLLDKRGGATQIITQTKVRHILLQPNELRDEQQSQQLIQMLHQRLQAGEAFADLAREHSDDPGSGSQGGDLGWVNPGDMVPEFDQTMQRTANNTLSEPFQSQFGWHILTVEDRRETDIGVELQRNQIRQMLYSRRFEEELPIWLRKIRAEAYVDVKERQ
ncbi:MAG: peptidylprolyl isomerase [Bacterioplanes sp.]|nr:peptidylprolyl isomerase [Bacterioplanes sp.]